MLKLKGFFFDQPSLIFSKYGVFEYWDAETCKERVHSNVFHGATFQSKAAQFWPAKFVFSLVKYLINNNPSINFQTNTKAEKVKDSTFILLKFHQVTKENDLFVVHTERGVVKSQHLVYATNAYTPHLIPELKDVIKPIRGQILVYFYNAFIKLNNYRLLLQFKDFILIIVFCNMKAMNI